MPKSASAEKRTPEKAHQSVLVRASKLCAGPSRTRARLERVPQDRSVRASRPEGEGSLTAGNPRRPTRVGPRPKTPFTTTGAPPSHRIPGPQAEARSPTESDSEDSAPRHMASFRRQLRRAARRPRDSNSRATRAGTRPHQRRKGVVSFSEIAWGSSSAIQTRSSVRRKST